MLVIVFCIFVSEKALDLYSRRLYFYAMVSDFICISLDILSIFCIAGSYSGQVPRWITLLVCKLYVASLIFQSYEGFLYAANEFFIKGSHNKLRWVYRIACAAGILAAMILPIDFYMENRIVYSFGPSTSATYVFTILFIVSTIFMAFQRADISSRRRRRTFLLWQGCWLLAAVIQMFNAELLLVGFASAFGMVLLYAELENPHEGIDRLTGLFTANIMSDYIRDRYTFGKNFSALSIVFQSDGLHNDIETEKKIFVRSAEYLGKFPHVRVFRNLGSELVLIFKNREEMETVYRQIREELSDAIEIPIKIHYLLVPDSIIAGDVDEFFEFYRFLSREAQKKEIVQMDETAVARIREQSKIRKMIEEALKHGRVEVFYQPIYNVAEKRFTSAEALVRIRDEEGNIISPGDFIPVAEKTGLIVPLGEEIFKQVCALLAAKDVLKLGISYIEVNLSVVQFERDNLAEEFLEIAKLYGIDFANINLEITETASFGSKQTLLKNMETMMEWGTRFSLDDFGTGRSNLDYFVEMPVDIIKFDYKFTQGYFKNEKVHDVMKGVIEMMKRMGLYIVSEGVETEEQLRAMCGLGVDYIQGYYFSKPIPKEQFLTFLKNRNQP